MKILNKSNFPLFGLGFLYLITRLYYLLLLPIFTDESIYIYWAKIIATSASHWFISLTDGKPPLLVWTIALFLKILPSHWYLLAGRLPSVISGAIALLGIYKLTNLLFKSDKPALIASLLYIVNPFILLYDRMALFDSLLTSMLLWTVYFAIKTAKNNNIKDAVFWGIFLGLSYLSKPTAAIFLILTPICYLIFSDKNQLQINWEKAIFFILTATFIGEFINNLQRLSHVYYLMAAKNQQFQQPWDKLLTNPFELTVGNLHGFFGWIIPYYTIPIFVVGLIAFLILLKNRFKEGLILLLLWFAPIFILATVGREIFPRYILFTTPYFLIAIAYLIYSISAILFNTLLIKTGDASEGSQIALHRRLSEQEKHMRGKQSVALQPQNLKKDASSELKGDFGIRERQDPLIMIIITILILLPSLKFDYLLLTNPPTSPLPDVDYRQYISEHPSGYGLNKIFVFLNQELEKGTVNLVIQGTFGLYPYAFNLEYWDNPNLKINPRWPLTTLDPDIEKMAKSTPTYILLKEYDQIPSNLPLKLVLKAEKPGGKYPILLTQLK